MKDQSKKKMKREGSQDRVRASLKGNKNKKLKSKSNVIKKSGTNKVQRTHAKTLKANA